MKHRILLVEDDPAYGEFLKFWLESEGHEAILAETLEDGFVKIATEPQPDVVLLDVNLGKHNGLTLAHWARKQRHLAHLTIAAITGMGAFKDLKSIEEAGCDTCFCEADRSRRPSRISLRASSSFCALRASKVDALRSPFFKSVFVTKMNFLVARSAMLAP
jgi:CheY-like chemotaxis protein